MRIYNTLTKSKDIFRPIIAGQVSLYTCGPTVYHYAHIGNMRTYVFEDVLRRTFEGLGYRVNHVMNITDVGHLQSDADDGDDKMAVAAKREQKSPWDVAKYYEQIFFQHSAQLNIKVPNIVARATEHIAEMQSMISALVQKGYAYESEGNIYFAVSKFPAYPDFARLKMESQQATERVEFDTRKRNQADFALWFSQSKFPNQVMKWDSPWGVGFPGWHIECSAMATKYLGEHIDIHCGGIDHIPVHHTNEIAQSECCFEHQWVNYWMHGAFLTVDEGKMSKSEGNFLTVDSIKQAGFHPLSYRYLILTSHYRNELRFSYETLAFAETTYKGLYEKAQEWRNTAEAGTDTQENPTLRQKYADEFWQALEDDLHTPNALACVWAVVRDEALSCGDKLKLLSNFDTVLGLRLTEGIAELSAEESEIVNLRAQARLDKKWAESDRLRDVLLEKHGVLVKDTASGAKWTRLLPPS